MTAEGRVGLPEDCHHCQSAGSVRAGRCQICEWEAAGRALANPRAERVERVEPVEPGGGTLTTAAG